MGAPTISGTSPNLTVTVPLSVYYLVEGGAPPAPAGGGGPMGMPGEPGMPPDAGAPPMEPAGPPGDMAE